MIVLMYIKWKTDNGTYLHKPAHNTVTEEKLVATEGHGWDDSMVRSLIGLFTRCIDIREDVCV